MNQISRYPSYRRHSIQSAARFRHRSATQLGQYSYAALWHVNIAQLIAEDVNCVSSKASTVVCKLYFTYWIQRRRRRSTIYWDQMGKMQAMCERMAENSDGCDASSLAGMLTSCSCCWRYIGVARNFSGVHFSSPKNLTTFLVVNFKPYPKTKKTTKLTPPAVQIF